MGDKSAAPGCFFRTKREVFCGTKIHLFWIWSKYLNFGVTYLNFGAIYLNFGAKIVKSCLFRGCVWGGGESPGTSGRFRRQCRETKFRPSLDKEVLTVYPLRPAQACFLQPKISLKIERFF